MKTKAVELMIVVAVLLVLTALTGCKDEAEAESKHIEDQIIWLDKLYMFNGQDYVPVIKEPNDIPVLQEGDPIEQKNLRLWGNIPKQNSCPHCGVLSYTRFCTDCRKERGNLPFIGVYCPKCMPDGKCASKTSDVTKICGDCGSDRTWKYIYEDWQTEPDEPTQSPYKFQRVP